MSPVVSEGRTSCADLVDQLRLLHLGLEQLLDRVLHNLAPLLHAAGEGRQRLLQLALHLRRDVLVLLRDRLDLGADHVERRLERARLLRAERLAAQRHHLAGVVILDRRASYQASNHPVSQLTRHLDNHAERETYRRKRSGAHRRSAWPRPCALGGVPRRHRPCPRNCWRLRAEKK